VPAEQADFAITAPSIFDGNFRLRDYCVVIGGSRIVSVLPVRDCSPGLELITLDRGLLAPGFVDLQVNGGGDAMFNNRPDHDTLQRIARAHLTHGTTSLLPTLVSDDRDIQRAAAAAVAAALAGGESPVLGIHFEGPFLAPQRRGAHSEGKLRHLHEDDFRWLSGLGDFPVLLTLAPETVDTAQIERLSAAGVRVCAGHTEASYEQMAAAAAAGLCGVTHLYNAMSQLHSRNPGAVGAALTLDGLWAGIIADGHHVHPAAIRLAFAAKPRGKLLLVSDAMATVGGSGDTFQLYGETIRQHGGRLVNVAGNLAGSAIGLDEAVRYAHSSAGLPLEDCLRMASRYPAQAIGMDNQVGRLAPGCRADIVHLDDNLRVIATWCGGKAAFHGGAAA